MKPVPYWRNLWRLTSVQLMALIPIIAGLREASSSIQAILPPDQFAKVNAVIAICAVLARAIQQPKAIARSSDGSV
jgi:hypothetical protein